MNPKAVTSKYKTFDQTLPQPIAFNSLKHHLGFTKNLVLATESVTPEQNYIKELLRSIGGSLIDFYTGELYPNEIANQVIQYLNSNKILDSKSYHTWIKSEGKDYRCINLSDGSKWTLRVGKFEERYVHIHPGRYSLNTIRVKSTTLKTVLAYQLSTRSQNLDFNIENINYLRQTLASLSPISRKSTLNPMSRLISLFNT